MLQTKVLSTDGIVEKRKYSTPTIKAVDFKVESGFAGSEIVNQGTVFYQHDRDELRTTGESEYHWNYAGSSESDEGWF